MKYNCLSTVLGLDVVTPESLFGYETGGIGRDISPGGSDSEEKVILPDTSQILQPGIEVIRKHYCLFVLLN